MSTVIDQDLEASGVASVIVVLKAPAGAAAAAASANDLSRYFTHSELSQESAIAVAAQDRATAARAPARKAISSRSRKRAEDTLAAAASLEHRPAVLQGFLPELEPLPPVRYYPNLGVAIGTVNTEGLAALRADDQVADVVGTPRIGLIRPTQVRGAGLRSTRTWGLGALGVPDLWAEGLTGKGVQVAHLDTGVDGTHPGLRSAIGSFAQFDLLGRQVVPDPQPFDTADHGTHTAGTIAGRPVDGRNFGVAPGAKLASAIVIEGGQVVARIVAGMDWAIGQGARVLSMSLGLRGWWDDFQVLTRILRLQGVLPVFAIGNEGPGTSRSPGNYPEALSVGAVDRSGEVAWSSSSQRFDRADDASVPDLAAPGVGVISAKPKGGFQSMNGTSMATPHVAGLAALLLEAKPSATVDELENALLMSCGLEPGQSPDRVGRGLPNGPLALKILAP
ncbi:subtilase family protein [Kribbella orskensis]|uniref:Subtilase family protein n=2 Tax=Kribbellaceae TaxID=2726069 RepID=A0ABY2BR18_9ACTN|nr:subtilase family protein [Kribbella sp. VKM Ac-2500]TCO29337.1 subtilase family protein [Kribbella orskensis]